MAAANNNALGVSGVIVNSGGALQINDQIAVSNAISLAGVGVGSGALVGMGNSTVNGPIAVTSNATIASLGSSLTLNGPITKNNTVLTFGPGAGTVIVNGQISGGTVGDGLFNSDVVVYGTTVVASAANSYYGPTSVAGGGLLQNGAGIVNALPSATIVTVGSADNTTGTYDLNGTQQTVAGIQAAGANGGTITDNLGGAVLTVAPTGVNTYSGQLAGGLNLSMQGPGTLSLNGTANTYTGNTTVGGGVLQVANLGSGGANDSLGNGAANNGSGGLVINGGTLQYVGGSGGYQTAVYPRHGRRHDRRLGCGAGELQQQRGGELRGWRSGNADLGGEQRGRQQLPPGISDGVNGPTALVKAGPGTWQLSSNSLYNGTTQINGGTLLLNNITLGGVAAGSVTINNGATLGGIGFVNGQTFVNNGIVAPGLSNAFGTLSFSNAGQFSLTSQSTFDFAISGSSVNALNISGGLSIAGTANVNLLNATGLSGNYVLATFAGTSGLNSNDFISRPLRPGTVGW